MSTNRVKTYGKNSLRLAKAKKKETDNSLAPLLVGMTRFEPATSRPPDVHSNLAELHPDIAVAGAKI